MMDGLVELGEAGFPHFHLDGQTAMVDDYLAVRPEQGPRIRRLAAQGRLSLGPWFTQMDEFLTSGESHIRNLERGLERARELARPLAVGYMPDQFGHIGQMPQLLRLAGIDRAVVWRGVPRKIDKTSFWWEAPDGSRVLTEYLAFGYANGQALTGIDDPAELSTAIRALVERMRSFLPAPRLLVMVGSDHAGPDAQLPARIAAAAAALDDHEAHVGGLDDHLDGPEPEEIPSWRGELRSSARAHLLPNVYSARVHQKAERGRLESLVERYAEPLAALVAGFAWPADRLDRVWRLLLWNGAHDSACGCSHDGVARDVDARFAEARRISEDIVDEALGALAARVRAAGVLRFNPSPFERDGVPGLGWRVDAIAPTGSGLPADAVVHDGWVEADGVAFTFRDEPDVGDLYNWCPETADQRPRLPREIRVDGGRVTLLFEGCEVLVRLTRPGDESFLRFDGEVRNAAPDHRLRLHVRLPRPGTGSVAGSPFELVERDLVSEGSDLEAPSPTWPARGVVLAEGIAVHHPGVFEYEVAGSELAVTVLRAAGTISRAHLATRPWAAGPDVPTPEAQMIGTTRFALGVQRGAARRDLLPTWERFALPIRSAPAAGGGDLEDAGRLLDIRGGAELSNVRRHLGAVEVRLWNADAGNEVVCRLAGRDVVLGPARIETARLDPC